MLRLATFNLENLFTRPSAMNMDDEKAARKILNDFATANSIIAKDVYTPADKAKLIKLTAIYKWHLAIQPKSSPIIFQKIRGKLFKASANKPVEVVANGRADWTGWFELRREDLSWKSTFNLGRVITETRPDILITVELENRPTQKRFNDQVLDVLFIAAFPHYMVIDGNDERGIDIGIFSRFPLVEIRSHVDDPGANNKPIFSRDCPEFDIILPSGERLVIIPNHFKSKRGGDTPESLAQRTAQAVRAHEIAVAALNRSPFVLIGGDLNDSPDSTALPSLFTDGFLDVMSHPNYPTDRPGTFGTGLAKNKIDYLIMSPQLRVHLQDTGIERRGSFHPGVWEVFDSVKNTSEEASDHQLVWADFDFGS